MLRKTRFKLSSKVETLTATHYCSSCTALGCVLSLQTQIAEFGNKYSKTCLKRTPIFDQGGLTYTYLTKGGGGGADIYLFDQGGLIYTYLTMGDDIYLFDHDIYLFAVTILHNNRIVGHVPRNFSAGFYRCLSLPHTSIRTRKFIHARINPRERELIRAREN